MKRREALKKTSLAIGSSLIVPAVLSALQGCRLKSTNAWRPAVLSDFQNELIKTISDIIIPHTNTPSASEVKVNEFIDLLLHDVFENEIKENFISGMEQFNKDCKAEAGKSFMDLSGEHRFAYLEKLDKEVMSQTDAYNGEKDIPFYFHLKELTILAYFSSEEGVKQNLDYVPVPGPYQPCIDKESGTKIMVGDHM